MKNSKLNIAFVSSGDSIHVKRIAQALVSRGNNVTLYTLKNHNKLLNEYDSRIDIIKLPVKGKIGYILNAPILRKYLIKGNYDIINCHFVSGYGTLSRLAHVSPLVAAVFGSDVYDYPQKSKLHMRRIIKNLDFAKVITSTSNVMAEVVYGFYGKHRPIYVTPFGVNIQLFKPNQAQKDEGYFTFGIVKKLENKYGIHILIKAFYELLGKIDEKDREKIRLCIYGRGSQEEYYKKLSYELGISKNIFFKGFINNELVPEAFCKMNVACFPSELDSESFGVAAVEAMSCGIPVIVSDSSGFTEVVSDKETGFIIPKKDVNALAEKMYDVYLMKKDDLKRMGDAGRKRVCNLYDFSKNMDTYIEAIMHARGE